MPDDKSNKIRLGDSSELNENLKPIKIGGIMSPIEVSNQVVRLSPDVSFVFGNSLELSADNSQDNTLKGNINIIGDFKVNGSDVITEASDVDSLADLSDVTYSSGDLAISGLDKISVAGDLDIVAAGGDINFKANEYGSGYDGGVNFNITSNKVEFIRNIEGGTPSRITFDIGVTTHAITTSPGDDLKISGDGDLEFSQSSTYKKIDFIRGDSSFGDTRLATANEWSSLAYFKDFINAPTGATGTKTYALNRGYLVIEDDTGFDNTFLVRMESDRMKTTAFTNYSSSVAGTIKGTAANHGYYTGDNIAIEDTTNYNDAGEAITKIDDDNFYITKTYVSDQTGKVYRSTTNVVSDRLYGDFAVKAGGDIYTQGNLSINEESAAPDHIVGYGKLWVKNDAPNNLYFTDDAGNDIAITNNGSLAGGGGSTTLKWHQTFGGYRLNNTSTSSYYMPYRITGESWTNADSSIASINVYDAPSAFIAPHAGTLTKIQVQGYVNDAGAADPVKFYVFKGTTTNDGTSTSLTQIGVTTATSASGAGRNFVLSTSISSSNSFTAGQGLWVALKKDSNSGQQDIYFSITISGEYS